MVTNAGLVDDAFENRRLADVVQLGGRADAGVLVVSQAQLSRGRNREFRRPGR
jgi:hypothetical protein